MKIKELISKSKEIIIRPLNKENEKNMFFDVFSYPIERGDKISKLYIIAQVQTKDSTLSYMPNLIAGFIKREIESSFRGEINKDNSLEISLRKANDLLRDLNRDRDIKFDIGVAFISGSRIIISKIGKAKMLLAREKQKSSNLNPDEENYIPQENLRLKDKVIVTVTDIFEEFTEKIIPLSLKNN